MAGTVESLREKNLVEHVGKQDRKTKEAVATEDIKVTNEASESTNELNISIYERGTARG